MTETYSSQSRQEFVRQVSNYQWLETGRCFTAFEFQPWFEFAIRRIQVIHDGLKLNGTSWRLVYGVDVNILVGGVHILKENADLLVVTSKEIGLEDEQGNTGVASIILQRMLADTNTHLIAS
jgi:hypothetical protein